MRKLSARTYVLIESTECSRWCNTAMIFLPIWDSVSTNTIRVYILQRFCISK
ncbi:hypothetical protein SLEP1_g7252 [Rubroshorea leprosula]|uniref:Uncharacterized protein n=1 Tax=Rubroshorea leprosula TaxID=152421 RepID=A0AAV5I723_9ROSI|nr:hypothetical protein SLEP1_g7252 [Rubroshorea leprosula]